ncbi:MAG TPA: hypothetical protein VNE58_00510 [Casimicrobiaceae bacterium]|nr:hypothetical protein [Casimicrobiaceae bacterium]
MPPGSLRAQRVEFIDHRGFDRPMLAATMLVPAAWRTQAGVEWKFGVPCASPYHFRLFAQSPDQSSAIELLPGESWGMSSFGPPAGGCAQGGFGNPREYLQAWVQQHRPGARWLDYRARPDRSREVLNQPMAGGYFKSWIETGEALIGYTQNGREMRETLAVTISFAASRFNGVGGTPVQSLTGQSMGILAWRAPQGQLDFRQFEAVWQTLRRAPEWQSRIDAANQRMAQENADTQRRIGQIQAQMSRDTMNEIAKRGQIMAQTRADIAAIQNQTYNARDATTDRMQRDNVRTIREIETYREPRTGGVVELPNHYRHAWQLRDGSYFLTDSQAFDPVRDLGIGGDKLQVAR